MPDLRILLLGAMALLIATYGPSTDRTASSKPSVETTGSIGRLTGTTVAGKGTGFNDVFKLDR